MTRSQTLLDFGANRTPLRRLEAVIQALNKLTQEMRAKFARPFAGIHSASLGGVDPIQTQSAFRIAHAR